MQWEDFIRAFRAIAPSGMSLVEMASHLNKLHFDEGEQARRRYVTSMFLRLNPREHVLHAVNAGHNPGFIVNGSENPVMIQASGTPVGMLPFSTYREEQFTLGEQSRLLFYTDGMTEVFRGEEEFGQERLLETFRSCNSNDPKTILDSLWQTLDAFTTQETQSDDMTALVVRRKP